MASSGDAEDFYEVQRGLADTWGIKLPPWNELSWADQVDWHNKLAEQLSRDKEADDPRL